MSDEAKLLEDVRRASIQTVVQHLRAIHELNQAAGPPPPRAKGGAGDPAQAANDYVLGLARLSLNSYDALLRFQSRHFEYLAGRVREFNRLYRPAGAAAVSQTTLRLRQRGDAAEAGLVVENPGGGAVELSFNTSEFRDADGRPVGAVPVMVAARRGARGDRRLEGGAQETYDLLVPLDPRLFAAGERYEAETLVLMDGVLAARVTLLLDLGGGVGRVRGREARKPARGKKRAKR
jgi:hypothetical protein